MFWSIQYLINTCVLLSKQHPKNARMDKNTPLVLLPKSNDLLNTARAEKQDESVPSAEVINTILNYSKALKVEQCKDGKSFIEYITN
jgi:hypothetical protein